MRIAVMGSGGLGGYFGGLLARGGAEVVFIARGAHLDAMRRGGLRIEGGLDPFHLEHVRATDDPGEIGPADLVMVCVKLWDTEAALEQLRPLVGAGRIHRDRRAHRDVDPMAGAERDGAGRVWDSS